MDLLMGVVMGDFGYGVVIGVLMGFLIMEL